MKKGLFVSFLAVAIIGGMAVGYIIGNNNGKTQGKRAADKHLSELVNIVFPKPPETIKSHSGIIKGAGGGIINLEIVSMDDYLPHTDGTPQETEIRYAYLLNDTKITLIDFTQIDDNGNPKESPISFSDLKEGDAITVRSNENIRDAERFDVTEIDVFKY